MLSIALPHARTAVLSAAAAYGVLAAARSLPQYEALTRLPSASDLNTSRPRDAAGALTVVVPARNEARILPRLLASLGPLVEHTLVVDDASADGTGNIARAAGAQVLRLEESDRPAGWLGKPHACQRGAEAATGDWLLFLDADTEVPPDAVRRAIAHATGAHLEALSLFLRQRCETFWERLLLPFAYQQFFAGVNPRRLRDPLAPEAVMNGQFILIRRDVYERTGGHGAVRASIVEDVALARTLKAAGVRIETLLGEDAASVRMYDGLAAIRRGFGKNAYAFLADDPVRGVRVAVASMCACVPVSLLAGALGVGLGGKKLGRGGAPSRAIPLVLGAVLWVAHALLLAPWVRRFGGGVHLAALQPVAAVAFNVIAMESSVRSIFRLGLTWKGRTYR